MTDIDRAVSIERKPDVIAVPPEPDAARPTPMSIAEFLQHCSTFITQHKVFAAAICAVVAAIAGGGFVIGQWKSNAEVPIQHDPADLTKKISVDLAVLSETAQSNFDRQSYFYETLTELLHKKALIDSLDAQRLLTGVIVFEYRNQEGRPEGTAYEKFTKKLTPKYRVTQRGYGNSGLERGIVLSSELDERILCEFVRAAFDSGLLLTFVERAKVPPQNNYDRYSIQVNAERSDVEGAVKTGMDEVRVRCRL